MNNDDQPTMGLLPASPSTLLSAQEVTMVMEARKRLRDGTLRIGPVRAIEATPEVTETMVGAGACVLAALLNDPHGSRRDDLRAIAEEVFLTMQAAQRGGEAR